MVARRRSVLLAVLAVLGLAAVACSSGKGGNAAPDAAPVAAADGSVRRDTALLSGGYPRFVNDGSGLTAILGTPDLGVGEQRVSVVLSGAQGLIRLPVIRWRSYRLPDGADGNREGPVEVVTARFHEFPLGTRGLYVARLAFDRPGTWALEAEAPRPDGTVATVTLTFPVAERADAPSVGDAVPPSVNRTLRDVASIHDLSTGAEPDPELYRLTIAEAVEQPRPLVVVFASPGFCTNALCGPQVEMMSDLRLEYGDAVDFIHVDLYVNPQQIQGDLDNAIRTPVLAEWGLHTDEWTFVVDGAGRVSERFEAFATIAEVRAAIEAVLQ